jgi:hypothetical protein
MEKNKVFCEECRDDVEYRISSVPMTGTIKGKEYSYIGKEARCTNCGSLVFVPAISDANLQALYDVFRLKNDIELQPLTGFSSWIHDDITSCGNECSNFECERNLANKISKTGPFSMAQFKDTEICPLYKEENNDDEDR